MASASWAVNDEDDDDDLQQGGVRYSKRVENLI